MDEAEVKLCPNCKRDIPCVNYTTHTVHCLRNIRMCPVCKEPVLQADLQDHHDQLHKLLPCKQCGESVCGTDLEDHIRDSCANTIKSCRFCELEVPRRELPAHEGYCGVRTEQCPDCREWVMIRYRQLHLDSNHGFLRLDDDPAPLPKKEPPKLNLMPTQTNLSSSTSSAANSPTHYGNLNKYSNINRPAPELRYYGNQGKTDGSGSVPSQTGQVSWRSQGQSNGVKPPLKRTNDQPQINTDVAATDKVNKELPVSRGAIKKRPAPRPPAPPRAPPSPSPTRDQPYYSALERQQREEKERQKQNAYNLSVGLPPVLTPAAKVEKLRKMDALHNRETNDNDYKSRLQGRVWAPPPPPHHAGHVLGTLDNDDSAIPDSNNIPTADLLDASDNGNIVGSAQNVVDLPMKSQNVVNLAGSSQNASNVPGRSQNASNLPGRAQNASNLPGRAQNRSNLPGRSHNANILKTSQNASRHLSVAHNVQDPDDEETREQFRNLKPMSTEEFMDRFHKMQLRKDVPVSSPEPGMSVRGREKGDRFSEIKSSLRELRRGLNEVTAPYNLNSNVINSIEYRGGLRAERGAAGGAAGGGAEGAVGGGAGGGAAGDEGVVVPCEFCARPVPIDDLVQHQTGCRPDLTQYRPRSPRRAPASPSPAASPAPTPTPSPPEPEEPVIPCEFCAESLPVYLISEHQERCIREANLLYAD